MSETLYAMCFVIEALRLLKEILQVLMTLEKLS